MFDSARLTDGSVVGVGQDATWQGTGVFDNLIEAFNANIKLQYDMGRLKGSDYASVYLGGMQSIITQSVQVVQQEKLIEAQKNSAYSKGGSQ